MILTAPASKPLPGKKTPYTMPVLERCEALDASVALRVAGVMFMIVSDSVTDPA
jgi:hypothetical protein